MFIYFFFIIVAENRDGDLINTLISTRLVHFSTEYLGSTNKPVRCASSIPAAGKR